MLVRTVRINHLYSRRTPNFSVDGIDVLHCFDWFVNEIVQTKSVQNHFFSRKKIQKRAPNCVEPHNVHEYVWCQVHFYGPPKRQIFSRRAWARSVNERPPFFNQASSPKGLMELVRRRFMGGLLCWSFTQLLLIFVSDDREGSLTVLILESRITWIHADMRYFLRGHVRIFVVQEQLNTILGSTWYTALYGGLLESETVGTGSFGACAVRYWSKFIVSTRPEPLLGVSYCIVFCCSAATTACSIAALPSVSVL